MALVSVKLKPNKSSDWVSFDTCYEVKLEVVIFETFSVKLFVLLRLAFCAYVLFGRFIVLIFYF